MTLLRLENISLAFGEAPLLDSIHLQIEARERIFLIGRNGIGKSCLFKIIMGSLKPDQGKIHKDPSVKIAELAQTLPDYPELTVYEMVAMGLDEIGNLLKQYHQLTQAPPLGRLSEDAWLKKIEVVQRQLEQRGGWEYQQIIASILTRLELSADKKMGTLSGGWQRRAALAQALVCRPDLLLLDEPTNHLDLEAIEWLEDYLAQYQGALLCITHDRTLLKKLSQRIIELDRGKITSWVGNYDKFLQDKEHRLEVEAAQVKLFDKKLAKEEAWIRQGIKARRTRNEGRVRALKKLREERKSRRELQDKPTFKSNNSQLSGDLVINAENIHYKIQNQVIVRDFSIRIHRGDKIALVGPNGVGKTTLLKILIGKLAPQSGKVTLGTNLEVGYFDQLRSSIQPELSVIENVAGGRETIQIQGMQKHIISYLSDFLFTSERVQVPVKMLSGGECNRLLLAKLFSFPTNFLILDEPTNDLDIESLELLESILVEYKGTLLLVSHDRTFVDEVATSTLYFSGNGEITEYIGGYGNIPKIITQKNVILPYKELPKKKDFEITKPLFTSKMQRELEEIPQKIALLEKDQQQQYFEMSKAEFYTQDKKHIDTTLGIVEKISKEIKALYNRWELLEEMKDRDKI